MMQYTEQELARIVNERDEEELYELHEEKLTASSLHCIFFWNNEIVPLPKTPSPDFL